MTNAPEHCGCYAKLREDCDNHPDAFENREDCKYPALLASHDEAAREIAVYMQTTKRLREELAALRIEKTTLQTGIKNAWSVIDELRGQLAATQDDKDALLKRVAELEEKETLFLSQKALTKRIAEQQAEIERLRLENTRLRSGSLIILDDL